MEHPERIGRYRIEGLLGVGSFATVWLGHDEVLDARVAIKVLAENWSHDLRVRERFVEEARLLWRLEDERLARVHAFDELPDGRPYAVLAWADGGSLRGRLESGPLDVERCLWLLAEIAAGVQVLHDAQIVHRDLTPGNVLFRSRLAGDEQVLVADLGLAKELAAASGLTARAGTPGFMAPEQDHPLATVDRQTDVYALGRIGVVLLTESGDVDGGWRLRPGVSDGVGDVLRTATAQDPADRYPDASAFLTALADAAPPGGPHAPRPSSRQEAAGRGGAGRTRTLARWWGRRRVVAAGVSLALAGAAVMAWSWWERDTSVAASDDDRVRVRLPEGWQAAGSGWSGRTDGDGAREPALVVSPDPGRWATDTSVPGAFIGLSPTLAAETTPEDLVAAQVHGQCEAPESAEVDAGGVTWVVATFAGCRSGKATIVEAASSAPSDAGLLYAQIAPPASTDPARFVESMLAGIEVGPP
ncbi:serine/threonine-protein kinase [Isoptericola croceus]|uniref:serine/threonine-protein kinase n=1 Tax=Isoptericola croceus TaxID=3031406 RepID=UPI0023F8C0F0|nr:serine/threonine-protein kinase [Isoptericola croceus]